MTSPWTILWLRDALSSKRAGPSKRFFRPTLAPAILGGILSFAPSIMYPHYRCDAEYRVFKAHAEQHLKELMERDKQAQTDKAGTAARKPAVTD